MSRDPLREALRRASSDTARAARAALWALGPALDAALQALLAAGRPALSAPYLAGLEQAAAIHAHAARLVEGTPPVPDSSHPSDPLARYHQLERALAAQLEELAAWLGRLHRPLTLTADEAISVARWHLGGPPPRRAGLLSLAGALESFAARTPLSATDLERLRALARAADEERAEPDWAVLFTRLRLLQPGLLSAQPLPPLYRTSAPPLPWARTLAELLDGEHR